ncbi:hypothetical protein SMS21_081 [Pseudomonas phage vB_PaeM_SMS21]|uniref:Uncharacterized protein n=2 Tax=Pbunavirus PA8P1 TaxID=2601635 RepID=A0A649V3G6_9CAUD|nr:hypothetical protein SMS12_082 [Pseudomonas phage vB_PaeM_SMS12]QGJ87015.1 hypothetical protein SMS21_081 [Pseudomonas phage vB_PaeM_SMS21]
MKDGHCVHVEDADGTATARIAAFMDANQVRNWSFVHHPYVFRFLRPEQDRHFSILGEAVADESELGRGSSVHFEIPFWTSGSASQPVKRLCPDSHRRVKHLCTNSPVRWNQSAVSLMATLPRHGPSCSHTANHRLISILARTRPKDSNLRRLDRMSTFTRRLTSYRRPLMTKTSRRVCPSRHSQYLVSYRSQ